MEAMKPPDGLAGLAAREAGHLEEPPPADARLLALANRALAERVAELEAEVERLRYALDIECANSLTLQARVAMLDSHCADRLNTLQAGYEEGVDDERAAVVAWLRDVAETMDHNGDKCCGRVEDLADAVAHGDHRREEER